MNEPGTSCPAAMSSGMALGLILIGPIAGLGAGMAVAQKPLDGRAFVPPEPRAEIWVDLQAMRDTEVWEGMERSMFGALLGPLERELGFPLDALKWLRGYPPMGEDAGGPNDNGVLILAGTEALVTPAGDAGTHTDKVAGYEVVVVDRPWDDDDDPTIWVAPAPGVLVYGAHHAIAPVLRGERAPGVTPPEMLSLTAGRGVLAHMVMTCTDEVRTGLAQVLELQDGGPLRAPDYLMLRLRCDPVADGDEPHLQLDATLRYDADDGAAAAMAEHVGQLVAGLSSHPRLGALKWLWQKIETGHELRDVTAHVDLGRPRDAGAVWALLAPLFALRAADAAPAQVLVAPAPAPVPEPKEATEPGAPSKPEPEPKPPAGGGDGGGQ